ncbi:hypothetical protein [Streptomyces bobili]
MRRMMPAEYTRPAAEAYVEALNSFSHSDDHHYGEDFEGSGNFVPSLG